MSFVLFGVPSLVGLPANVLAVPVAGIIMLVGFPLALTASVVPDGVARVLLAPCALGVRWVDGVAAVADWLDLPPTADAVGWLVLAVLVLGRTSRHRRLRRRSC